MKKYINRLNKIIRVYYWPSIWLILLLESGALVLLMQLGYFSDLNKTMSSLFDSLLMIIATFAGIFIPISIDRKQKNEDDRRRLTFALSFLHGEIRSNLHILRQIKLNYEFSKIMDQIPDLAFMFKALEGKVDSLAVQDSMFRTEGYLSVQQSGSVTTFDEDEYINDVSQGYENLQLLRSGLVMLRQNVHMKVFLFTEIPEPPTTAETALLIQDVSTQLDQVLRDLNLAIKHNERAYESLEKRLVKLDIKLDLIPRYTSDSDTTD